MNILEKTSRIVEAENQDHFYDHVTNEFGDGGIVDIRSSRELITLLNWNKSESENMGNISNRTECAWQDCKLQSRRLYIIQFAAEWCGLCRSIQPMVDVSFNEINKWGRLSLCIIKNKSNYGVTIASIPILGIS